MTEGSVNDVEVPAAVREHLEERVRAVGPPDSADPSRALVPVRLPEGEVQELATGGSFGWSLQVRADVVDGRVVVECLEDSRMGGQQRYLLAGDGSRQSLPVQRQMMILPAGASAEDEQRIEQEYYAHNRAVTAELHERGFGRSG